MKRRALEITKPKKGEPTKAILYIDEELSFINGAQIREEVVGKFDQFDQLIVQANLVHIDLTGVQILFSLHKTCEAQKKQLTLNIKMGDELKTLVSKSGFKELLEL